MDPKFCVILVFFLFDFILFDLTYLLIYLFILFNSILIIVLNFLIPFRNLDLIFKKGREIGEKEKKRKSDVIEEKRLKNKWFF